MPTVADGGGSLTVDSPQLPSSLVEAVLAETDNFSGLTGHTFKIEGVEVTL